MKVLMISLDRTPFTKEQRGDFLNRLKQYAKLVKHITVITYTPHKNYKPITIGEKITLIPSNNYFPYSFPFTCKRLVEQYKIDFDIIVTQDLLACGIGGKMLKVWYEKPLICNLFSLNKYYLSWQQKTLKFADLVRCESKTQETWLRQQGYKGKVVVAPIGFDLNKFRPPKKRKANNTVLFVGRLSPEKNLDLLLKAASYLPHVWFDIVGEGEERGRLEKMKTDNVKFFGNIPHDRLRNCYNNSDVLVLTSKYEGLPTVIVEAMSNGLPVITTDFPDAHNIVDDGVTGYIIPQDSVGRLRDCITILMLQPNMRERMGQAGFEKVHKEYSGMMINKVVDGWKSVLK